MTDAPLEEEGKTKTLEVHRRKVKQ